MAILFTFFTFVSTLCGGIFGLKHKDSLHLILGFTAGVILGVVSFDILPEIIKTLSTLHINSYYPMIALICGFMTFHIFEKTLQIHHAEEENYSEHKHPEVGLYSAIALSAHSFMDGVGIGLGFKLSAAVGIIIALAVIAHDFTDGLNTVVLMLVNKNTDRKSLYLLLLDATTPILGAFSTLFFNIPESFLVIYLGFFAGFLLYISTSDILPEAHSQKSSYKTILMTILGLIFIFTANYFIGK